MKDPTLIRQFRTDPKNAYGRILQDYSPIMLRMIGRFISDPDDKMDVYTAICERLKASDYKSLRQFHTADELTPWLSVVVANACRDQFRKNRFLSTPKSVLVNLNDEERFVFRAYYQERMPHEDIAELMTGKFGRSYALADVIRLIEKIDSQLSTTKRWYLLTALAARSGSISLDDVTDTCGLSRDENTESEDSQYGVELLNKLKTAVGKLALSDQLLIQLWFDHGLKARRIASIMRYENSKYVYTRLRTITYKLRRQLKVTA